MSFATTIETALRRTGRRARAAVPHVEWRTSSEPAVVVARAGAPIAIVFRRAGGDATSECVCFPDLGILQSLTAYGDTLVELGQRPPGRYRFCAPDQGGLEGWLVVEP